ncbi:conserved hypothetical protein [Ricinus communis]|uniref:Uncharacterized protein n=1 Tax=Ricinus communis TaxID=3988 RepID=B9RYU3_RICCO|nr:conserved hypothetical protein [Ricinus communis]
MATDYKSKEKPDHLLEDYSSEEGTLSSSHDSKNFESSSFLDEWSCSFTVVGVVVLINTYMHQSNEMDKLMRTRVLYRKPEAH